MRLSLRRQKSAKAIGVRQDDQGRTLERNAACVGRFDNMGVAVSERCRQPQAETARFALGRFVGVDQPIGACARHAHAVNPSLRERRALFVRWQPALEMQASAPFDATRGLLCRLRLRRRNSKRWGQREIHVGQSHLCHLANESRIRNRKAETVAAVRNALGRKLAFKMEGSGHSDGGVTNPQLNHPTSREISKIVDITGHGSGTQENSALKSTCRVDLSHLKRVFRLAKNVT